MKTIARLALAMVLCASLAGALSCKKKPAPAPAPASGEQPAAPEAAAPPANVPAATAAEVKSYKYVLDVTGAGPKMRFEYLIVPPKMNMKLSTEEGGQQTVTMNMINDGTNVFILQDQAKIAMKMPADFKAQIPETFVFAPNFDEFKKTRGQGFGVESQGAANINGRDTTKYVIKNPAGVAMTTVYVDSDNMIRRFETNEPGQPQMLMDVAELVVNPSISGNEFSVPSDYTVQEMPPMSGMAPPAVPGK